jgi:hypothetical protein
MANKDWRMAIVDFLLPELNTELTQVKGENEAMVLKLATRDYQIDSLNKLNYDLSAQIKQVKLDLEELKKPKVNALEDYLSKKYPQIDNIRYNQKRKIAGKYFAVELNQFITPGQFSVQKYKKQIKLSGSLFTDAKLIGDTVSKDLTWTDDKNLDTSGDYYLYAEEILCTKKGDCEDHSFLVSSLMPEIGVAYGFLLNEKGERIGGHAFNIFTYADTLYILDTVGNSAVIQNFNGQYYSINYIITPTKTFVLDSSVSFGSLAGWED